MTEAWGIVVAALITGASSLIGLSFKRLRSENRDDHAEVQHKMMEVSETLKDIKTSVDKNGERLTDHLEWHGTEAAPKKRSTKRKSSPKK